VRHVLNTHNQRRFKYEYITVEYEYIDYMYEYLTLEHEYINQVRTQYLRRLSLFGHVVRLDPQVPANKALLLMVNSHEGRKPSSSWTRPPGRPRRTWLNLVQEDANAIQLSSLWRTEIFRGHGAAQRSVRTTRR